MPARLLAAVGMSQIAARNGRPWPCTPLQLSLIHIYYANVNINECSLLEALQSPLFMAYYENQPFNENHLRPCPLLDNTGALARMVHASGAHSTDMLSPEDVEELTEKCRNAAEHWAPVADALWREKHGGEGGCAGCPHAQAGN